MRGGHDTDTVAAIAGGLLGAVYGASAVPSRWRVAVAGLARSDDPRPDPTGEQDRRQSPARHVRLLVLRGLRWPLPRLASFDGVTG
ncbi:ADP-ribosylglycohydrolase family protein [Mycobacterium paraseoulense]|uniref:ADP-ribosylglycohydrolase family protein n=1 Tax=Mycobacterium paraseoulense TaxID=590652 RepID=UPI001E3ABAB7|nr:ADP-ribosylglycohydrolase family protein [Mycobacterium paraseoulense]